MQSGVNEGFVNRYTTWASTSITKTSLFCVKLASRYRGKSKGAKKILPGPKVSLLVLQQSVTENTRNKKNTNFRTEKKKKKKRYSFAAVSDRGNICSVQNMHFRNDIKTKSSKSKKKRKKRAILRQRWTGATDKVR